MLTANPGPPRNGSGKKTPLGYVRPPTGGRLSQVHTPSADRLTPMPDYMRPVTKSAPKRWKKLHEDHMMAKLVERRNAKKEQNKKTRDEAIQVTRRVPIDVLAKDWMKEHAETAETRAFLVDKILPTLILGVEKLLTEVDHKGLADKDQDPNFNPINFLAQYLMRNNPKYSNFSEASPYIRGLREVGEQLKQQLFDMEENRLVRIKLEARRKREERENKQREVLAEKKRREGAINAQYYEWTVSVGHPDGRMELALIQNAVRSFSEIIGNLPEEIRETATINVEVGPTDDTGKMLQNKDFVAYLKPFTEDMSREAFDQFIHHMSRCAMTYRSQAEKLQRKSLLTQLFVSCDHGGVGQLDRHRILNLFEMFYDKAKDEIKESIRNPRKWPVVELSEEQFSDNEEDGEQKPRLIDNNVDVTEQGGEGTKEKDAAKETTAEKSDDAPETDKETSPEIGTEQSAEENADVKDDSLTEQKDESLEKSQTPTATETHQESSEDKISEDDKKADVSETKTDEDGKSAEEDTTGDGEDPKEDAAADEEEKEASDKEKEMSLEGGEKDEDEAEGSTAPSGDLQPPMTQQSRVSFAEGTSFEREKTLLTSHGTRSQSQASAFDENLLNVSQFVHLNETFLGDFPNMDVFSHLARYIREGYMETEDERMARLMKARLEAREAKRKALLNSLFEMWDNDGSGMIDMEEVETIMKKYKEGLEEEAINKAKADFKKSSKHADNRLSKREFRDFFHLVVNNMSGGDGTFDFFIEFLINSVERTYQERVRGEARKKWLQQIITAAETSGANMEPVYKMVFQALYKDAENHGGGKKISAYVAMLETNHVAPPRGALMLRYAAATPNDADCLLGKALFMDMKGISFAAVDSGKPIHVPRVQNHGNIHFWNPDRDQDRDGSFIVVPLKDRKKRVFGLLGLDTLDDPNNRALFITHEIQFFQGVAKAFSIAFHHVDVRQKTMRISESAISWIQRRCPHVHDITVYMVEPETKSMGFLLRRMAVTDHKGNAQMFKNPARLERKDNLFRDYLFKCVDNSESVTADAYGERHLAFPLRDDEGRAIVVVDISIGTEQKQLPKLETKEVMKMLRLLQMAYKEISRESKEGEKTIMLEGDKSDDSSRTEILFDRLMLLELRDNVAKLDAKAYAELKSYKEPPPVIHNILKAVLGVFHHDKVKAGEFDDWTKCKTLVNPSLSHKILAYDPTEGCDYDVPIEVINRYLDEVPHGTVSKHGSMPAQYLYNWVFVCVSLIEHTRKMAANKQMELVEQEKDAKAKEASKPEASNIQKEKTLPAEAENTQQETVATEQETAQTET